MFYARFSTDFPHFSTNKRITSGILFPFAHVPPHPPPHPPRASAERPRGAGGGAKEIQAHGGRAWDLLYRVPGRGILYVSQRAGVSTSLPGGGESACAAN